LTSRATACTALERAYADAIQVTSELPERQCMDAADRLAEIAERHPEAATRMQYEEVLGSHTAVPLNFSAWQVVNCGRPARSKECPGRRRIA
jgi:hypothetical protein